MSAGATFDRYLDDQLANPTFKEHYERKLANLRRRRGLLNNLAVICARLGKFPSRAS